MSESPGKSRCFETIHGLGTESVSMSSADFRLVSLLNRHHYRHQNERADSGEHTLFTTRVWRASAAPLPSFSRPVLVRHIPPPSPRVRRRSLRRADQALDCTDAWGRGSAPWARFSRSSLFVADARVFPSNILANCQATVMSMAHLAADHVAA
jgi:hypothetical protein